MIGSRQGKRKRGEVVVIARKKVKMSQVEFDMKAIREIKEGKKKI